MSDFPKKMSEQKRVRLGFALNGYELTPSTVRDPNKAFVHIISWKEFEPHLEKLNLKPSVCSELRQEAKEIALEQERVNKLLSVHGSFEESMDMGDSTLTVFYNTNDPPMVVDFSLRDEFMELNSKLLLLVHKLLLQRNADLQRGDLVRLGFVRHRNFGSMFFDGTVLMEAEQDDYCDYYCVPSKFLVPTQFPLTYWEDCGDFLGWARGGDLCYDVTNAKFDSVYSMEEKECYLRILKDVQTNHYVVFLATNMKNLESGQERFYETGRCDALLNCCLDDSLKKILLEYVDVKRSVLVNYL